MDPAKYPASKIPLNHAPYGPLTEENLKGANQGKIAVVTGAARGSWVSLSHTYTIFLLQ